jgi:parallel beta-helix repeat protein
MNKKTLFVLSILLLQILALGAPVDSAPDPSAVLVDPSATNAYAASRVGISINGNAQLNSTYGVTSGSGTASDPYIIENYMIDDLDHYPILIQNTDKHVTIRNCYLYTAQINTGLYVLNCTNLRIENCILYYDYYGIYVRESTGVNITGCTVYGADEYGIYLYRTNNTIVSDCVLFNNTYGITVSQNSYNNQISGCRLYNHYYAITAATSNTVIEDCTISGATTIGISAGSVSGITISGCDIGQAHDGIIFNYVNDSTITRCYIHDNGYDGISTYMSNRISINYCDISGNANSGVRTYYDTGDVVSNCNLHGNAYYGVEAGSSAAQYVVSAANCYWGSASGPGYDGTGPRDAASANVNYSPYLSSSQTAGHRSASDLTAPVVELTVPFYGSLMNGPSFPIGANFYDNVGVNAASVDLKVDNVAVSPGTKTNTTVRYSATLTQGAHNATVTVADAAGNTQALTWSFFIDTNPAAPIRIFGNDDLISGHGVAAGSGTQGDPFVIQGRAIDCAQGHGITMLNTDKYVVVRDCSVSGGGRLRNGMLIYNVANALIQRIDSTGNHYGMYFYNIFNTTVDACTVHDNDYYQVDSKFYSYGLPNGVVFSNCVISGSRDTNERGLGLLNSPYTVINCTFFDCHFPIHQQGGSKNQFINCTFYDSSYGIMMYSSNNTISGCVFYNVYFPLVFSSSGFNNVTGCTFDSSSTAISLGGNYNTITYCTFYNNSIGVTEGGSGTEIHQCNFLPFSRSLAVSTTGATMNATYCYWGSNDGPKVYGSSGTGSGDMISTNVLYDPWLNGPADLNSPTLRATVQSRNGTAGSTQTFTFEVRNNAASQKTIYLTPLVPSGWSGSLSQSSITLGQNQTGTVTMSVTSPAGAAEGYYAVSMRSSGTAGGTATGIGSATYGVSGETPVEPPPAPSVALSQTSKSGAAGSQQTYSFTISNNGDSAATYTATVTAPTGWTATASSPVSVAAGGSAGGTVYITSPASAAAGAYSITLTVTDAAHPTSTASRLITYVVTPGTSEPSDGGLPLWLIAIPVGAAAAIVVFFLMKKRGQTASWQGTAYSPSPAAPATPPPPPAAVMSDRKVCPKCGTVNKADAKFCLRCGNRL